MTSIFDIFKQAKALVFGMSVLVPFLLLIYQCGLNNNMSVSQNDIVHFDMIFFSKDGVNPLDSLITSKNVDSLLPDYQKVQEIGELVKSRNLEFLYANGISASVSGKVSVVERLFNVHIVQYKGYFYFQLENGELSLFINELSSEMNNIVCQLVLPSPMEFHE